MSQDTPPTPEILDAERLQRTGAIAQLQQIVIDLRTAVLTDDFRAIDNLITQLKSEHAELLDLLVIALSQPPETHFHFSIVVSVTVSKSFPKQASASILVLIQLLLLAEAMRFASIATRGWGGRQADVARDVASASLCKFLRRVRGEKPLTFDSYSRFEAYLNTLVGNVMRDFANGEKRNHFVSLGEHPLIDATHSAFRVKPG
jgi:hypothetical protein